MRRLLMVTMLLGSLAAGCQVDSHNDSFDQPPGNWTPPPGTASSPGGTAPATSTTSPNPSQGDIMETPHTDRAGAASDSEGVTGATPSGATLTPGAPD